MKRKIFSSLFALILALTLGMAALPAAEVEAVTATTLNVAKWSTPAPLAVSGRQATIKVGDTYHMWYAIAGTEGWDNATLHYTSSGNPDGFTTGPQVTFDTAPKEVGSVTVCYENGTYYMIAYETDAAVGNKKFAIYTSTNGTAWTYKGTVFDGAAVSSLVTNFVKIDAPYLFKDGLKYRLYFQVKSESGQRYDIFTAESTASLSSIADGNPDVDFTLASSNPVLSPDSDTAKWDGKYVMHPMVVKDGGAYYMWYSAHNDSLPQQIGFASSADGYAWHKSPGNPILPSGGTYNGQGEPSVIKDGDTWRMWYLTGAGGISYLTATGPFEFSSIQSAIVAAPENATINVAPGTYNENIVVNKSLTLNGAQHGVTAVGRTGGGESTINAADGKDYVVEITSNNVKLDGFTITGISNSGENMAAVILKGVDNCAITNNILTNNYKDAINLWSISGNYSDQNTVSNNVINGPDGQETFGIKIKGSNNTISGNHVYNTDTPIHIWSYDTSETQSPNNNVISGNTIAQGSGSANYKWGIDIKTGHNNTVTGNTITGAKRAAIYLYTSKLMQTETGFDPRPSGDTISNNIISGGEVGIALMEGARNSTISGNTITGTTVAGILGSLSRWPSEFGNSPSSYLTGAPQEYLQIIDNTIKDNTITNCGHGIAMQYADGNTLTGNTVESNTSVANIAWDGVKVTFTPGGGRGIYFDANSSGNAAHFNNISGNTGYGLESGVAFDATNNWWGANDGPSFDGTGTGNGDKISDNVDYDPWLKLNVSANPDSIVANGTSTSLITADMTKNSNGDGTLNLGHIPDGTQITFTTDKGSIGSLIIEKTTKDGKATATLTSSKIVETANVSAVAPGDPTYSTVSTTVFFTPAGSASTAANTNLGSVNFSPSNGFMTPVTTISPGNMQNLPAGYSFPYGFFGFNINNLTSGGSTQVTINFPNPLPLGVKYFKIQNGQSVDCSSIMTRPDPHTIILRLTDGGVGDADGIANGTIVDPGGPAIPLSTTPTSHQSSMPIMPQAPVQLSNINVKTAALSATKVSPGSQVTVTANVANTGTGNGSSVIKFYVNGSEEYSQPVTVNSGGSTTVTHDIIRNEPGTYTVYVNGTNAGSFTVDMFAGNDMLIYGIIALFTIGIIGTLYLLVRRRPD